MTLRCFNPNSGLDKTQYVRLGKILGTFEIKTELIMFYSLI
jgi:hypothetical protein